MLHMKNVALVISLQYELVNFFLQDNTRSHGMLGDNGRRGGGGEEEEEESSTERSDVIRFTAHLE